MSPDVESPPAVTVAEAGEHLGVNANDVENLLAAGALRRAGGTEEAPLIALDSVLEHLSSQLGASAQQLSGRTHDDRPGGALGSVALTLLLLLWTLAFAVELISAKDGAIIMPLPLFAGITLVVMAASRWLALRQPEMGSVNGLGTTLYGRRRTDEGFVATEWVVALAVPLVPLRSYVLLEKGEPEAIAFRSRQTSYLLRRRDGLHWPQAGPVIALVWGALITALVIATLMGVG
ncbi:MAG: hypothetical protein AAGA56_24530 [Myxococcota bacterium]